MSDTAVKELMRINHDDNLNLLNIPLVQIPDDVLFPEELNQYLRGRIEYLTQQNARLEQNLLAKDEKISQYKSKTDDLSNKISEYEIITQDLKGTPLTITASKLMSTKIVELSKRLREKSSEIEVFKTRYSRLQNKLVDLENRKNVIVESEEKPEVESVDMYTEQVKSLTEKLTQTNNKLFETKNQNTQLKNDLKLANKILSQEIGDGFTTIQQLTMNPSGWRGRAQQILSLQQKYAELQERVNNSVEKEFRDSAQKGDNRKQIIEQLNKELFSAKKEMEDNQKKLNGARARIKVLESDCQSLKMKTIAQNEKINSNEQMIRMLNGQISSLEDQQSYISKETQVSLEEAKQNFQMELAKERCKIENLAKTLQDKEKKIDDLKYELTKNLSGNSSQFMSLRNHRDPPQNEKINSKINVLEVEVNRLLELVAVLNQRLENERKEHSETQVSYRKERQRAAKLETKMLRLEMEMNMFKSQSYSKSGSKLSVNSYSDDSLNMESMKNNMELAQEHIKALEAKLVIIQREKEMDHQRFSVILSDMKNYMKKHNMDS